MCIRDSARRPDLRNPGNPRWPNYPDALVHSRGEPRSALRPLWRGAPLSLPLLKRSGSGAGARQHPRRPGGQHQEREEL
eukprot:3450150-Alexandrium_andersonii.AAC.1